MSEQKLPSIAFGTAHIDDVSLIKDAIEMGYRYVDTAEHYGTEQEVGSAIKKTSVPREEVVVATKIGYDGLSFDDILRSAKESLTRLGIDYVDILYIHWPFDHYDPQETMAAMDELVEEGLVSNIGVSNFSVEELEKARNHTRFDIFVNQVEMHPLYQQSKLVDYATENGINLVAYGPLMAGEIFKVPELSEIAEKHGTNEAAVAFAWLLQKDRVVPVTESTSREHLAENLNANELPLDKQDIELIEGIERESKVWGPDGLLIDKSAETH